MEKKEAINVSVTLWMISFLSTGMFALMTFPRSLHLVELGISVVAYGVLISIANVIICVMNMALGRMLDRSLGLDIILSSAVLISLTGHFSFVCTRNPYWLAAAFVLEMTADKVFSTFIYKLVESVSGDNYGSSLGMYKIAGSIAWVIFAAASGYIVSQFGFPILVLIVVLMGGIKLTLLIKLLRVYKRYSGIKKGGRIIAAKGVTFGIINLLMLYMLMQLQSNGGFSYLQIYLSKELGLDEIVSGYIISSSGFFEIFLSMGIGRLCDVSLKSSRRVLVGGCLLSALRWLLLASSDSIAVLILTQFLHGVMICTINITFMSYLRRVVLSEQLGTMMGVMGALNSLGTILGASMFGFFSELYTLRTAYCGLGIISVIGVGIYLLGGRREAMKISLKETCNHE